ncbi:hypothetical protein [Leptospira sanjuanensis]|uniref:hypothetical protein n=1 Tax=Leptospira sanjuanensis TaxID=2879643 RepID=UPI001EE954EA|nr:hypothetical protein [Leptospira sanjuanensis]MCG6170229.1 hypothetical protein [Leptospira sanjuanensis]
MDQELNLKGKEKPPQNLLRKETPEEFLLKKESELGKPISDRFRSFFYRELNAIPNRSFEQVWEVVFGRKRS